MAQGVTVGLSYWGMDVEVKLTPKAGAKAVHEPVEPKRRGCPPKLKKVA